MAVETPKAFVTGASRGIGAKTAEALAHMGWDIAVGYETRQKLADGVVATVQNIGRDAIAIGGDITIPEVRSRIIDEVSEWAPYLGALVLNAAGGMEPKRADDTNYPMAINRDAQVALARGFMPNLADGGNVVYVQSYVGSLHGQIEPPSELYGQRVAGPKNAGESALRELIPELAENGIRLLVTTGGIVEGTTVGDVTIKRTPEVAEPQRKLGNIVTVSEMGWRIAAAIVNPHHKSGHVEIVGAKLEKHLERGV